MIRVRGLGECVIEVGSTRLTPESEVLFAVLLYLTSNAGRVIPRDELVEVLWPDCTPRRARHRLRQALYQLRRLGIAVPAQGEAITIDPGLVRADHAELEWVDRQGALTSLTRVSEFLPGYAPVLSARFAEWLESERYRVHGRVRRALERALDSARARGAYGEVVDFARACLAVDPLNENATLSLAEIAAMRGDRAHALRIIDTYCAELVGGRGDVPRGAVSLRRRISESAPVGAMSDDRSVPPLVGRSALIRELEGWVRRAGGVETEILALVGEPGIGKTRLLHEGACMATLAGWRCVGYRASPSGKARALAGLFDLLPQLLSLPGALGCAPASFSRLRSLAHGVDASATMPEDSPDSSFRFASLRRAVLDLFEAVLAERRVLLALDDAQWLDAASLEILMDAIGAASGNLAALVAARPSGEATSSVLARASVRQLRVPPLDEPSARRLLLDLIGEDAARGRGAVIDWAIVLANGNPFSLVELSAHCRSANPTATLPESMQTALERRLDAVSSAARLFVQACATLRQNSTLARLERMLGYPPRETAQALAELEGSGLITAHTGLVTCRHDLIADAVVRVTPASVATYLHRRSAAVLDDEIRATPVPALVWDCALHWDAAGEHERALELTILCADHLLSLGLPGPAAELCVQARRYCRSPEQHADLLLRLSRAHKLLGDWNAVVDVLEQRRLLLAERVGRVERYSDDEIALFEARWWRRWDYRVLKPAIARASDANAPNLHRLQMAVIALIAADNHQRRYAADLIAATVESISPSSVQEENEHAKARLIYHSAFGDLDAALASARRVVDAERKDGTSAALLKALRWSSTPLKFANNIPECIAALDEAFAVAEHLKLSSEMAHAAFRFADLALDIEDSQLAATWIARLTTFSARSPYDNSRDAIACYINARLAFMQGEIRKSRELIDWLKSTSTPIMRTRAEESVLALDVLLRIREARDVESNLLSRLNQLHLRTRSSGVRDFETGALLLTLHRAGKPVQAARLYNTYVSRLRRSRLPLSSTLEEAQSILGGENPRPLAGAASRHPE